MRRLRSSLALAALPLLLVPFEVWARTGGGEHYVSPSFDGGDSGGDGGEGLGILLRLILELVFRYPSVGIPLLIAVAVGYVYLQKTQNPTAKTQRAFQQREAQMRTQAGADEIGHWVSALQRKDPAFDLQALYGRASRLFLQVQEAWFRRDLTPVRPLLSDATYERLKTQLGLLQKQGVRDAVTDMTVHDVALIGVEQNHAFDIVHLRVRASARDTDVAASKTDDQAIAAAKLVSPDSFVEVWTFMRKPGAQTRMGQDASQGKCPNCGAPFQGGATNACEYCSAVVNSGNYDWVVAEITQGQEHQPFKRATGALRELRANDPALSTEALEDRASLIFWRWIEAHSTGEPRALAKLSSPSYLKALSTELDGLKRAHRQRVFLECAVGGVDTLRVLPDRAGRDEASVEIRWSARMAIVAAGQQPDSLPPVNQRSVLVLTRKAGATTPAENGMATSRCPNCNAPLTATLTSTCDFCGAELASGDRDWVLEEALTYEAWNAREWTRGQDNVVDVVDVRERERLLAMMAAVAAADGVVDARERNLLQLCATRWSVPWANVEYAMANGEQLFDRLVPRGTGEAEAFLRNVVSLALIDGKVDRKERKLLEDAARHLGVADKLQPMLRA